MSGATAELTEEWQLVTWQISNANNSVTISSSQEMEEDVTYNRKECSRTPLILGLWTSNDILITLIELNWNRMEFISSGNYFNNEMTDKIFFLVFSF